MLKENEMAKYKINKNELIEHWNNQIRFIQKSITVDKYKFLIKKERGKENEEK